MKHWFISDTHFNHANIIRYENRPFNDCSEMNKRLIKNINERIKSEDMVYFLGDFCFYRGIEGGNKKPKEIMKQLNGNWIFVKGNHDKNNGLNTKIIQMTLNLSNIRINCVHDPIHVSVNYPLNIVGHVHGAWLFNEYHENNKKTFIVNVSVENWNYAPVEFNEILKIYNQWKIGKFKVTRFDKEALREIRKQRRRTN